MASTAMETDVIIKRFERPDNIREVLLGRFEIVHLGGLTLHFLGADK